MHQKTHATEATANRIIDKYHITDVQQQDDASGLSPIHVDRTWFGNREPWLIWPRDWDRWAASVGGWKREPDQPFVAGKVWRETLRREIETQLSTASI